MTFAVELPRDSYRIANLRGFAVAPAFDLPTAGAMAWLSQLAYEKPNGTTVSEVLQDWQLSRLATLRSPKTRFPRMVDTSGLIVTGCGATIVVFAGTDPFVVENWLTDLNAVPSGDHIHSGFQAGVESVWEQIKSEIGKSAAPRSPLFVTGHSLGGALAVVAAKFLHERLGLQAHAVYTFGMPRCLGSRIVSDYERTLGSRTYRLVHGRDIVPTLPPSELDFRHVGRLLHCRQDNQFDSTRLAAVPSDEPAFLDLDLLNLLKSAVPADLSISSIAKLKEIPGKVKEVIEIIRSGSRGSSKPTQPGLLGEVISWLPSRIRHHVPAYYLRALGFNLEVKEEKD